MLEEGLSIFNCVFCFSKSQSCILFQPKNDKPKRGSATPEDEEHFIFAVAEVIFVGWFTFEYIIRYIAAPQKWRYDKIL